MKEKLELKHLSAYLAYGLKFQSSMDKPFEEYGRQPTWTFDGMTKLFGDYCLNTLENSDAYSIQLVKPILRPLSDLTKEIEVNGEKFVPLSVLVEKFRPLSRDLSIYLFNGSICIGIETEDYSQTIDLFDGFLIIQKLIKWHFDIFGLIEKGLAIDINTLKK
jgi:hypothetical protein